jgi:hypothetical protein
MDSLLFAVHCQLTHQVRSRTGCRDWARTQAFWLRSPLHFLRKTRRSSLAEPLLLDHTKECSQNLHLVVRRDNCCCVAGKPIQFSFGEVVFRFMTGEIAPVLLSQIVVSALYLILALIQLLQRYITLPLLALRSACFFLLDGLSEFQEWQNSGCTFGTSRLVFSASADNIVWVPRAMKATRQAAAGKIAGSLEKTRKVALVECFVSLASVFFLSSSASVLHRAKTLC